MINMNYFQRTNGIILPVSSLPSAHGIGTLGKAAFDFVDFLSKSNVHIWQILPLNPTGYGDSPYQSFSSNGLNYYFIDLDELVEQKLLLKEEIRDGDFFIDCHRVDYSLLFQNRLKLLKKAYMRFDKECTEFLNFLKEGKYNDFAFYMTMKKSQDYRPWYEWPKEIRTYSFQIEDECLRTRKDDYLFFQWTQFEFIRQYRKLKEYAHLKQISLMGDMPLYLARDSVEVYKYPKMFLLDRNLNPTLVAGCPPDYFSKDGQLWGNPIYNWAYMERNGYLWFHQRILDNLQLFDILRIDHFRGLSGYYVIPFGLKTARIGQWRKGPGMDLFKGFTDLPIIAEDLGEMDDDVKKLLKETGFPGMKVLEFAFDGNEENDHLPSNSTKNYVVYTGTHDNEPLFGYLSHLNKIDLDTYKSSLKKQCLLFDVDYKDDNLKQLVYTTIKLAYADFCNIAIIPLQDLLCLGDESRMNVPSRVDGKNWLYRFSGSDFTEELSSFIQENVKRYKRN